MGLLIVEDEARIAELVRGASARVGFAVDAVGLARTKALLRRPGGALGMILKAGKISFEVSKRPKGHRRSSEA